MQLPHPCPLFILLSKYDPSGSHCLGVPSTCTLKQDGVTIFMGPRHFGFVAHWKWQPTPVLLLGESHGQRSLLQSMVLQRVRHN